MNEQQLLTKLISFDSQSFKSNESIVDFIASLFPSEQVEKIPLTRTGLNGADVSVFNLIVKFPGKNSDNPLIFSGHTDTVPVSSKWTRDPFNAELIAGKLYGLGATDMKSGLAAMILAALEIKGIPEQDIYFLFDADEEDGCTGGKDFAKRMNFEPKSANIILAEPTDCELEIGNKGGVEVRATFYGKALHSSRIDPEINLKDNAIHKVMEAYDGLKKLEAEMMNNIDPLFGFPTQAITQINGGTAPNVLPDECTITINRRLLPNENCYTVYEQISEVLLTVCPKTKLELYFAGEPNLISKDSRLYKAAEKISLDIYGRANSRITSGWTQAGLFKRWGDCLIWGPGTLSMAHQADEYLELDQVGKMKECYLKLIEDLAY